MDDEQIIKALECCLTNMRMCNQCPYNTSSTAERICFVKLKYDAMVLIGKLRDKGRIIP